MNKKIQILRAFSIIAVIMIHTCPGGNIAVAIRPFLNFCVAMFIFLSGLLTDLPIENKLKFYKKRIMRILIPYLVWTFVYSLSGDNLSRVIQNVLTTDACYTLYYVSIYIQLVLITPFLFKLINSKYHLLGWLIQPLYIVFARYMFNVDIHIFCSWFSYYYFGLLVRNGKIEIKIKIEKLLILYFISIALQILEGLLWWYFGNAARAVSQVKVTNIFTCLVVLALGYRFINSARGYNENNLGYKMLVCIGNCSFGVYLAHPLILQYLYKIPQFGQLVFPLNAMLLLILTLICVIIARLLLKEKFGRIIGVF